MSDTEHTAIQVADMIKSVLEAWPDLSEYTVLVDQSGDIAIEDSQYPAIVVAIGSLAFDTPFSSGDTEHTAAIETEVIDGKASNGVISRNNLLALSHINAAIITDRESGAPVVTISDITPVDAAPTQPSGRDSGAVSLQWAAKWNTPQGDWTTFSTDQ